MSDWDDEPATNGMVRTVREAIEGLEVAVRQLPADLAMRRRERIATAVLAAAMSLHREGFDSAAVVAQAVKWADALIAELDK